MKKNKQKIIIVILLIISLALLSSCGGNNPQPVNIYTGTQGLTINFMKNIPPEKVYEEMQFMVIAELWNKGAYPLNYSSANYGVVTLDYDPLYFTSISSPSDNTLFYENDPKFELEGKSISTPLGERKNKELAYFKVNTIPGTRESPITTIKASVCYPYQTLLSQEVCVDMDYMNEDKHPPCRNQPSYSYSGQGAPIVISSIESSMIPLGEDKVQPSFKIKIRNTGSGLVFSRNQGDNILSICSPSTGNKEYSDINGLRIEATLGTGDIKLKCVPEIVKLYNDEADATCFLNTDTMSLTQSRNYMTLLTIKLDYAYRSFTTKQIEIQRLPQ